MTFVRFIGKDIHPDSNVEMGIFSLAYQLRDEALLAQHEAEQLTGLLDWFKQHLPIPKTREFGSTVNGEMGRTRGICWFRSSSNLMFAKLWELKILLEGQGIQVDMLKADQVGYHLYSDEYQAVAEPRMAAYQKLKKH